MELVLSIAAIVISLIAVFSERLNNQDSLHDQAYDKFSQFWFGMDQIFIDYPYMHRYFYHSKNDESKYVKLTQDDEHFDLAICIAERFCDVFQYTEPLEKYLKKEDKESYAAYKEMIKNSASYKMYNSDYFTW